MVWITGGPPPFTSLIPHQTASFGPQPYTYSITAPLAYANPTTACTPFSSSSSSLLLSKKIVLVHRGGNCSFADKIIHVQNAGAVGVIVGDDRPSSTLVVMAAPEDQQVEFKVPAVFISQPDYVQMLQWNRTDVWVNATLDERGEQAREDDQALLKYAAALRILSIVLMVIPSLWCLFAAAVIIRRVGLNQRNRRRRRMRLAHIPTVFYRPVLVEDKQHAQHLHNSACAICLDEFEEGLEIKRLDCSHAFHISCIDPWLQNRSDLCPICKRSILEGYDSEEEDHLITRTYRRVRRFCCSCCRIRRASPNRFQNQNQNRNQQQFEHDVDIDSQSSALLSAERINIHHE